MTGDRSPRRRRVLYVHVDAELKRRIAEARDAAQARTTEHVTEGAMVRRLIVSALEHPRARRRAGLPA